MWCTLGSLSHPTLDGLIDTTRQHAAMLLRLVDNFTDKIANNRSTIGRRYIAHVPLHRSGKSGGKLLIQRRGVLCSKPIKFGISCEPDDGRAYYLFPRSSISKTPLRMSNSIGLIDGGYRGEIMAMCDNIKGETYTAQKGQRLFQLVASDSSPIHYELSEELSETTRGHGGFGSTGA